MNPTEFVVKLANHFDKQLSDSQLDSFGIALSEIPARKFDSLFLDCIRNSKRFPSVAEILILANEAGERKIPNFSADYAESNCQDCRGSGLIAVLYQDFVRPSASGAQILESRVMAFGPYHLSSRELREHPSWTTRIARCDCGAMRQNYGGIPVFDRTKAVATSFIPKAHSGGKTREELKAEFDAMMASQAVNSRLEFDEEEIGEPESDGEMAFRE